MNFGTAVVLLIVIALVALALRSMIGKKGSCSCGCEGCGSASVCRTATMANRLASIEVANDCPSCDSRSKS